MNFHIADTFTASVARLSGNEQKAVKATAFELQLDPVNPGVSLQTLRRARHGTDDPTGSVMRDVTRWPRSRARAVPTVKFEQS